MMPIRSHNTTINACILSAVAILALVTACGQFASESALTAPTPLPVTTASDLSSYRATPVSQSPASGICARLDGDIITFTIYPDIPDPRCVEARSEQRLSVVNRTAGTLHVVIGMFEADIEPDDEHTFDMPVGEYLVPGVHWVQISPCCSPELLLKPGLP